MESFRSGVQGVGSKEGSGKGGGGGDKMVKLIKKNKIESIEAVPLLGGETESVTKVREKGGVQGDWTQVGKKLVVVMRNHSHSELIPYSRKWKLRRNALEHGTC